jgi:uncharacterized protein with FMN-binding domain
MRRVIFAALSTVAGLTMLLSFKSHPATTAATTPATAASSPPITPTTSGSVSAPSSTNTTTGASTETITGAATQTRYGPVQVRITVRNGQVTAVTAVDYPTGTPRDAQINSYAIPQLNKEALAAKSAKIDMISGATYTSTGYITSLQSALINAGVA